MTRRGFTLVELSIVLVIIGLLIGGILVAQSMIGTVKVQSYLTRLSQYEIAITNFKTNYKLEPGASPIFVPPGNVGGVCNGTYLVYQSSQVWAHLTQANMLKGNYVPYEPQACGGTQDDDVTNEIGTVLPEFTKHSDWVNSSIYGTHTSNRVPIYYNPFTSPNRRYNSLMKTSEAVALDAKLDDGLSISGKFQANNGEPPDPDPDVPCNEYINTGPDTLCAFNYWPDEVMTSGSCCQYW